MKKWGMSLLILAVAGMIASAVVAQPPGSRDGEGRGDRQAEGPGRGDRQGPPPGGEGERGDRDGRGRPGDGPPPGDRDGRGRDGGGREGGRRDGGGRGFGPPPNPLMEALDADGNHVISAAEIRNAAKALLKLDKDGDGELSHEELRPDFGGRPPGQGGFDGPPPGDRDGRGRDGGRDGGRPPGEGQGRGQGGNNEFLDRIMSFDEDKDGKLTRKEMPERMQRLLDRGDANKDGALDRSELERVFEEFRRSGGRRGDGPPPGDGDRPPRDGDRPPRDGDRPPREDDSGEGRRPSRPESE